jgi:rhodanese-related sulfurtransferase
MKNPNRAFKDAIYEQFARIGKSVSSPKRLELLDLLCQGERTVEVLAKESGLTIANASQHLQVLRAARLVEAEKNGLFVIYRLADQTVCEFFRAMRVLAESQLAEVEQIKRRFLEGREGMEPVDRDALLKLVSEGAVTVLDVRPVEEYNAGHIPGALSIPLKDLTLHLSDLPHDQEIVAYCRGPYCVLSIQAVEMLRAKGRQRFPGRTP